MAKTTKSVDNHALYSAALEGLELQKARVEEQIAHVRSLLGQRAGKAAAVAPEVEAPTRKRRKRRKLSAEARKRIGLAQKRRWAEFRKSGKK